MLIVACAYAPWGEERPTRDRKRIPPSILIQSRLFPTPTGGSLRPWALEGQRTSPDSDLTKDAVMIGPMVS